jgi:arylsulfatase
MRWPAVIKQGEICNRMASSIDILPTLAEITGASLPEKKIDGVSIFPLMRGDANANPRKEFLYYYEENSLEAVQKDFWKLVLPHKSRTYRDKKPGSNGWPGQTGAEVITKAQLYDLRRDPGEWYDVAEYNPEKVKELLDLAEEARKDLGDNLTSATGSGRRKSGNIKQ